jgi:hypothetical protein
VVQRPITGVQIAVKNLREECEQDAATCQATAAALKKLKEMLAATLADRELQLPIFPPEPNLHDKEVRAKCYRILVQLLHDAAGKDLRQRIIARFVSQEKICAPKAVIAEESLKNLRKQIERRLRAISAQDYRYFCEVEHWLRFATRLIEDYRRVKGLGYPKAELIRFGYTDLEASSVMVRRLVQGVETQVACRLVARRSNVQFASVQNAYRRIRKYTEPTP